MLDPTARDNFRLRLFSSIGELADLQHQRATWLDPEMQNPHYTFAEFLESFYDVAGGDYHECDPKADEAPLQWLLKEGYISPDERDAIWPLHLALEGYEGPRPDYNQQIILNDPAWQAVTVVASHAKARLLALPLMPSEKDYFVADLPSASQKRWP